MTTVSFYRLDTGALTGSIFTGPESMVAVNTPAGCGYVAGRHDWRSAKVDLGALQVVPWQPPQPEATELQTWYWDEAAQAWAPQATVAALRLAAASDIDRAAGAARLRYITDVPGQQAVYLRKLDEATAYLADQALDALAIAPPHIAAEAAATGATALSVAQEVAGLGALWTTGLSPAIEAARIGGKRAVSLAAGETDEATAAAIEAARLAAIAALDAI